VLILLRKATATALAALAIAPVFAAAQEVEAPTSDARHSLDDAWWTGPMLAPSAATLPRGHFLIEPYLFDVISQGNFDRDGTRRSSAHTHGFGSLTYMNYGLLDKITVGVIPTAGYNVVQRGASSSGVQLGDVTLQAQYRLTQFREGRWIPATSVAVQETFPTGQYDRLGNRSSNGLGSGTHTTAVAFYSQMYFWLPNDRILRLRLNASQAFSSDVCLKGVSVYGTGTGFVGRAAPGTFFFIDASWEYSVTRRWVLALDAVYRHDNDTHVSGYDILAAVSAPAPATIRFDLGSRETFALAPSNQKS
jgi:hypothetical protein